MALFSARAFAKLCVAVAAREPAEVSGRWPAVWNAPYPGKIRPGLSTIPLHSLDTFCVFFFFFYLRESRGSEPILQIEAVGLVEPIWDA